MKQFDILKFLSTYNIDSTTEGKHGRSGWVQVKCPMCTGSDGYPGGFNIAESYYNCYRCGWHPLKDIISSLLGISEQEAITILKTMRRNKGASTHQKARDTPESPKEVCLPPNTSTMQESHRKYLARRNFDPEKLEDLYQLKGTNHLGQYKFRIIAPIYFKGQLVSYQGRDTTDRSPLKYKACPLIDEVVHHKNILYGIDLVMGDTLIIVEGITDVWRIGSPAVATFGTSFTTEQLQLIIKRKFKQVILLFDAESDAQVKARKMAIRLSAHGISVMNIALDDGDPGSLSEEDVIELRKDLSFELKIGSK